MLRLSADMLSTFANFTLGNAKEAQMAREDVSQILKEHLKKEEDPGKLVIADAKQRKKALEIFQKQRKRYILILK